VNPGNPGSVTWSQKHTDFALVLKSGQELKCHKFVLAESSSFFDTMLNQQQFAETATAQMKVEHLEEETVYSFLEYLYSNKVADEESIRAVVGPHNYIYKRSFPNQAKLTLDLMKMAHMYQVEDLVEDCAEHLKSTLCDHNVMERWLLAEKSQVKKLSKGAVVFLLARTNKIPINHIPGFKAAFDSNHSHLKYLFRVMTVQKNGIKATLDEVKKQRDEVKKQRDKAKAERDDIETKLEARDKEIAELRGQLAEERKKIVVRVDKMSWSWCGNWSRLEWSKLLDCKVTDTVQSLIDNLDGVAGLAFVEFRPREDDWLENNYRLEEYQINSNTTLYAFYHEEM